MGYTYRTPYFVYGVPGVLALVITGVYVGVEIRAKGCKTRLSEKMKMINAKYVKKTMEAKQDDDDDDDDDDKNDDDKNEWSAFQPNMYNAFAATALCQGHRFNFVCESQFRL